MAIRVLSCCSRWDLPIASQPYLTKASFATFGILWCALDVELAARHWARRPIHTWGGCHPVPTPIISADFISVGSIFVTKGSTHCHTPLQLIKQDRLQVVVFIVQLVVVNHFERIIKNVGPLAEPVPDWLLVSPCTISTPCSVCKPWPIYDLVPFLHSMDIVCGGLIICSH